MTGEPETVVIGQHASCDLTIPDDSYVSARHCQITRDAAGVVWVADLGSSNGTFLVRGGEHIPVTRPVRAEPGDILQIGRTAVPLGPREPKTREPIRVQAEVTRDGQRR